METSTETGRRWNVELFLDDMATRGWKPADLARNTRVTRKGTERPLSKMTVSRFISGDTQTAPVAKAMADALGYDVSRYYIPLSHQETKAS